MPVLAVIAGLAGVAAFAAAAWLTGHVRAYAWRRSILDHPGERSSHEVPTPRGGGLAVVAVVLVALVGAMLAGALAPTVAVALGWITGSAALVGALDDRFDLPAGPRLAAHLGIAAVAVWLLGPLPELRVAGFSLALAGPAAALVTVVWIAWIGNLYNFMDGIDGIAAVQGSVAFGALALWFGACGETGLALVALCTAAAVLGFMLWNWAPAAIFMGDAGSVALGMLYAGLAVIGVSRCAMPLGAFLVLLGVFVADATWTLARRVARREPFWRAHRSHFYQRAVRAGLGHAQVSGAVLALACLLAVLASAELAGLAPALALTAAAVVLLLSGGIAVQALERRRSMNT